MHVTVQYGSVHAAQRPYALGESPDPSKLGLQHDGIRSGSIWADLERTSNLQSLAGAWAFCGAGRAPDRVVGCVRLQARVQRQRELRAQRQAGVTNPAPRQSPKTLRDVFCKHKVRTAQSQPQRRGRGCTWPCFQGALDLQASQRINNDMFSQEPGKRANALSMHIEPWAASTRMGGLFRDSKLRWAAWRALQRAKLDRACSRSCAAPQPDTSEAGQQHTTRSWGGAAGAPHHFQRLSGAHEKR